MIKSYISNSVSYKIYSFSHCIFCYFVKVSSFCSKNVAPFAEAVKHFFAYSAKKRISYTRGDICGIPKFTGTFAPKQFFPTISALSSSKGTVETPRTKSVYPHAAGTASARSVFREALERSLRIEKQQAPDMTSSETCCLLLLCCIFSSPDQVQCRKFLSVQSLEATRPIGSAMTMRIAFVSQREPSLILFNPI